MTTISANELKRKGISAIQDKLEKDEEILITVRGKGKYVVMNVKTYDRLRECELEIALQEARADIEAGRAHVETVAEHMKRVSGDL